MAARCLAVHETIAANTCHIACLQETKLQHVDSGLARFLGVYSLNCFAYKPANGTRGGILILWNDAFVDLSDISIGRYSVLATVNLQQDETASFTLSTVYGPSRR
jgi:exonuclease III